MRRDSRRVSQAFVIALWVGVALALQARPGTAAPAKTPAGSATRITPVEVSIEGVPGRVLRAELSVPENPAKPKGRALTIVALILAATAPDPSPDPVLVFQGGPGQSVTSLAGFYAEFLGRVRAHRDIVLIDQRGTGLSGALMARFEPEQAMDDLGAVVPVSWVLPTLEKLSAEADLTQYTTRQITDDAVRLIDALGYARVNLYGTSYGSRCALDFMRRHPDRVRTATIKNVLPMPAIIPLSYASNAQRALDLLIADVEADSAARRQYPDLRARLETLLRRLDASPARVRMASPVSGLEQDLVLTRAGVAMTLRNLLMSPQSRAEIPYLIDRVAADSLDELASQMVRLRIAYSRTLALGMSLSVVAAEDIPRITPELIGGDTTGTFLGGAVLASFRRACHDWPRANVDPAFFRPVHSTVPALLISGRMDPATPPSWGEEVARDLTHSVHVVFRHAAHPNAGFVGLDELVASFIESGTTAGLDRSCAERGTPLPFRPPGPR